MKPGRKKWVALAVLVCGLLGWALIGWVRGPREPPQFLTLPDGTKYWFGGVTWGTSHVPPSFAERAVYHLPAALSRWVQQKYGARLRLVPPLHTDGPELCVWLDQIEIPPRYMFASVSAMPLNASLADSDGVEAGTSYVYFGGFRFWQSTAFTFVPRRSRMLEVHFYHDNQSGRGAIGSVRFQNPLYGKFPQWQPEPLPATKMAGDVQVTLLRCSIGDSRVGKFSTSFVMDLRQPLGTNEHWTIQRVEASDATGNRISRDIYAFPGWGECLVPALFWPDEKAIRLRVGLKRTTGFTRDESITVTNLPLPVANATNGVTLTNQVGGHTVLVRNYVESMPLRIFLTDDGSLPGPYGISMVVADQPAELFAQIESVNTDSGKLSYEHQSNRNPTGDSCSFRSFPSNTGSLNVTVSVQKVRTVEFLVKPPNAK